MEASPSAQLGLSQSLKWHICTFSFVASPIICCENFAVFAACRFYLRVQNRSCGGPRHTECILYFRCIFLGVRVLSDFLCHSDNSGYLLPSAFAFAFTTPIAYPSSPHCFKSVDVKTKRLGEPYTTKECPRSLEIWGLGGSPYHQQFRPGGPHITGTHIALTLVSEE